MSRRLTVVFAALLTLRSQVLVGQKEDRPLPAPAACQAATSALSQLPLPQPGDSSWDIFPLCATGSSAFATTIGLVAGSVDTFLLNRVVEAGRTVQDSNVFKAFRALALNTTASAEARGVGLYGLIVTRAPGTRLNQRITTVFPSGVGCSASGSAELPVRVTPLPADYLTRSAAAARIVAKNDGNSASLRSAARCTLGFVKTAGDPDVTTSKLLLSYVCGNVFQVNNTNPDAADVGYAVDGTTERGTWHVPAGRITKYATNNAGTVRLYYKGVQFTSRLNGGTTCQ